MAIANEIEAEIRRQTMAAATPPPKNAAAAVEADEPDDA
ncbi:MAG: hypothetical protein ACJAQ8_002805 [Haliea salexigens]|jgi:hypothetical protein